MGTGSGVTNSSGVGWGVGAKKLLGVTSGVYHLFGSNCGRFFFCFFLLILQKAVQCFCPLWSAVGVMVSDLVINRKTKSHCVHFSNCAQSLTLQLMDINNHTECNYGI
jgi:hypothetical protein